METTTKVLGMNLAELSMRDICEEITDLKRDLSAIEDFEKGYLTYGELTRETSFQPNQKQSIIDGIAALKMEKQNRNTDSHFEDVVFLTL